jgi:hypothetical protein
MTRLVDLRLDHCGDLITADIMSGLCHLTCLVATWINMEAGALTRKTGLQHLELHRVGWFPDDATGVGELLSQLQDMQQLTRLVLPESLYFAGGSPPAAYAALTAGSKLQRLDIRYCTLPAGAWQHIFPAGRQLLHLQMLDLGGVLELSGELAATWHLH